MDILYGEKTKSSALELINKGLLNLQPIRVELTHYSADTKDAWVDLNISPIRDHSGEVSH